MSPSRAELEAARDLAVPDLVAPGVRLVFAGINPGLWTAAVQAHFAHPGNRFWKALHAAGILDRTLDVTRGFDAAARELLAGRGIGITNVVNRATARADELAPGELVAGCAALEAKVRRWKPAVVAFVGLGAYRTGFARPKAALGFQPDHAIGPARVWALPNPSGLNAHYGLAALAALYREAAEAAGIPCSSGLE